MNTEGRIPLNLAGLTEAQRDRFMDAMYRLLMLVLRVEEREKREAEQEARECPVEVEGEAGSEPLRE